MNTPDFWDQDRLTMTGAIEQTIDSLRAFGATHSHWAIGFSGGKDSGTVASLIPHLIRSGKVPRPKTLTILYADTRMELPPLQNAAMEMLGALAAMGFKTQVVLPEMEDRFFVYMLGRGVPPPSNTFRWCTPQLKVDPMVSALRSLRESSGEKVLMITGVRVGESAARDSRISISCGKNGSECGQGWFQETTPESVADTLAPILHWRVCLVWKWLRDYAPELGFPTRLIAESYGGDQAEEVNARTGCVGCNLASRDLALETIIKNPKWAHLSPLMNLRPLYAELKRPKNRLRKDGTERRKDGVMVQNPNRMGPLTFEARLWGLEQIKAIQSAAGVDLINQEEESKIRSLVSAGTWPNGWDGSEPVADTPMDETIADGLVQPVFMDLLKANDRIGSEPQPAQ
jgi:DNA sulfur modification protein DndC